ncbi:alpha-amylase [Streptomyces sp. NPDC097619]|uniref:alpha-amylase n=1 Tax=Streptomyces sp. NPDC097619 TaxID=3157228 RepID=UPI00331EE28D
MTPLKAPIRRALAGAPLMAALVLAVTTAGPAAGSGNGSADPAPGASAPACVAYVESWRYTDVHNGCEGTVSVTVEYVNGQGAPCRTIEPAGSATFSGYGTNGNHVTGLRTCTPDAAVPGGG